MVSARHMDHKTRRDKPSRGSQDTSRATPAHRWVPYVAKYQTCHLDIWQSLPRVHRLANAVANPANDT